MEWRAFLKSMDCAGAYGPHIRRVLTRLVTLGEGVVTLLPDALVARFLGPSAQAAREYFSALRRILRPALLARDAHEPRIWRT